MRVNQTIGLILDNHVLRTILLNIPDEGVSSVKELAKKISHHRVTTSYYVYWLYDLGLIELDNTNKNLHITLTQQAIELTKKIRKLLEP